MRPLQQLLHLGINMMSYKFSNNLFYPYALELEYAAAGSWPIKGVDVNEEVFLEFTGTPPNGKILITGGDDLPAWGDEPSLPDDILYERELSDINSLYDEDISIISHKLTRIYLFHGESEVAMKSQVYVELNERKSKYAADLDALDIKYGG
jgi:hypothetical protein